MSLSRVVVALGGNAMTGPDGSARPDDQRSALTAAMEHVADLVAGGTEVVLTHGNGPQVGNLLVKNELAADVVPPVTLDWCGAQTQATIGFTIADALESALARRGRPRPVSAVVTRTLVDPADPAFDHPAKPVGRYLPEREAARFAALGQDWADFGARGWRRVVPSPQPREILDAPAVRALLAAGVVPVAAGGGGVPVVRDASGTLQGVQAVLDKDRTAALLACVLSAEVLVVATDVNCAVLDYGTDRARPIGRISAGELRGYLAAGHFAEGSMGPKVEAAVRFVEAGGRRAVITGLDGVAAGSAGQAGTVVEP
ncbi:carbamate kinase [Streptomonospora wellingtoniae]|uniref:Carbamate kinase n=1 Tax=Streptomonospora wellingtoniae TaxID=3075544 RepID=A0ABU2KQC7_9ACTN|nr:carbamate kinase [Streptomonospora sp. DSM 45055]MDT0301475.1 carbamate kinase [Streptomonospora sp. DSM 45055]